MKARAQAQHHRDLAEALCSPERQAPREQKATGQAYLHL